MINSLWWLHMLERTGQTSTGLQPQARLDPPPDALAGLDPIIADPDPDVIAAAIVYARRRHTDSTWSLMSTPRSRRNGIGSTGLPPT